MKDKHHRDTEVNGDNLGQAIILTNVIEHLCFAELCWLLTDQTQCSSHLRLFEYTAMTSEWPRVSGHGGGRDMY